MLELSRFVEEGEALFVGAEYVDIPVKCPGGGVEAGAGDNRQKKKRGYCRSRRSPAVQRQLDWPSAVGEMSQIAKGHRQNQNLLYRILFPPHEIL